jgi:hypothetical protein
MGYALEKLFECCFKLGFKRHPIPSTLKNMFSDNSWAQ